MCQTVLCPVRQISHRCKVRSRSVEFGRWAIARSPRCRELIIKHRGGIFRDHMSDAEQIPMDSKVSRNVYADFGSGPSAMVSARTPFRPQRLCFAGDP